MGIYDFTFYDLINRNAVCHNKKKAWFEVDDDRTLTFSQYKKKVDRLAFGLRKSGVKKGDRIAVLSKNSLEYFLLYGAVAAIGAILLPLNCRLSTDELEYNLNDCGPKLLFVDKEFQRLVDGFKKKPASVKEYFNMKGDGGMLSVFESLMDHQYEFSPEDVSTDDGFVIMYTAAVAGRPRGALLSHGNIMCADMHFDYFFNLTPQDVHLNIFPLFHVGGLLMTTSSFHAGALNVNMSKFEAKKAVEIIREKQVSFMLDFSPVLSSILEQHEENGIILSSLKTVAGLETPETIEKYQQITGGTFYSMYGQTETSCLATICAYNDRPGSAGRVPPLAEVRLVDDYDSPVQTGQVGEIVIRGPLVFKGYWNLPKDTEYTFRNDWHHTGDLGRFDEDGFLWYSGRKPEKELIKTGGENVYPAEVEKVILEHPAVEKTVVFGVPDSRWKESIMAVCRLGTGHKLEQETLIAFVGERIAGFKKPRYVKFVPDFPLLEDGSSDRARIKKLYGE